MPLIIGDGYNRIDEINEQKKLEPDVFDMLQQLDTNVKVLMYKDVSNGEQK